MTLQLRPTFSESWYRVKNLRARLRSGAQISRQFYRGERWYVVRDPAGNQFHRLSDPAYRFVGLLDGSRTVEQAWDLAGGMLEDDAPTQPEVIQILTHLYSANLIDADVTPDATVLLRRHKQLSKRKLQNRLMNVLFPRIPLWDPDQFLKRWMPLAKLGLSKLGALVWLVVVGAAIAIVVSMWNTPGHSIKDAGKLAIDLHRNPLNLLLLYGTFVLIKLLHELGHAFSCRRFGGECHELGIMFLVFIPTPYVDASTAWQFTNKWHKIFVGAGGMIVELFVAGLCTFVWAKVDPTSLWGQLAFNTMLVAGVTTIVFNANPLLRYDGYYILSDFLEIPNLRQKSTEYTLGLIKRHVFRVKLQQPLPPLLQRFWLFTYAILSSIYRTFVGIMIILLVAFQIPVLGLLMALGGVITWAVVPVFKMFKYLAIEPELHRKRGRATVFCVTVLAAVIVLIGLVRFPLHVDATGVMQPFDQRVVRAAEPGGVVTRVVVHDRQWVKGNVFKDQKHTAGNFVMQDGHKVVETERRGHQERPVVEVAGDVLVVCHSDELEARIAEARAAVDESVHRRAQAVAEGKPNLYESEIESRRQDLDELLAEKDELTIRAPIDGQVMAPELENSVGRFLPPGQEVAVISQNDRVTVRTLVEQQEMGLDVKDSLKVEVRPVSDIDAILPGGKPRLAGAATVEQPKALIGASDAPVTPDPRHPERASRPEFNLEIPIANPNSKYVLGQRAYVRFTLAKKPLIWNWFRRFEQLIQERSGENKWI